MTSFCQCETCQRIKKQILERMPVAKKSKREPHPGGHVTSIDQTHQRWATSKEIPDEKSDKWIVIRVSVDEAIEIRDGLAERMWVTRKYATQSHVEFIKDLYFKVTKLLVIEDD